ncbi:MAG TPA: hypothetical protein PKD58_00360 [Candidatus Sumerlaeota bacterium]|nr:hypothetical protein [Candidatus Sumerlaeota bacterium]HMX61499.1 hypothetical protein [Candidatus Sumerlaeota bacterium]HMZ52570.1 hypothetical protein [Candidatus Sumerlaeota bacterium]HNM46753.1 hypothetical protein [Candidatus Sumerlaeota bacterium]
MLKKMTFEHLETGRTLLVEFDVQKEGDHWAARMRYLDEGRKDLRAPVFYGSSAEQAERQLRKVFEKEYELTGQELTG